MTSATPVPAGPDDPIADLRGHLAELCDLGHAAMLMEWDSQTGMPAGGTTARGHASGTISRLHHERIADPRLAMLLDAAEAAGEDPDVIRVVRGDHERARRVPAALAGERTTAGIEGQAAWVTARGASDFSAFAPALRRNVELCRRYAACFPEAEHPYDALLDGYEEGATTADVRAVFAKLQEGLVPLLREIATAVAASPAEPLVGPFPAARQRELALEMAATVGYDPETWRIDAAPHPFMAPIAREDVRITTREDEDALEIGIFGVLHETGHGLYEHQVDPALDRTTLGTGTSLGMHESQSRLWENVVGRSPGFWSHWHPRAQSVVGEPLADVTQDRLLRAVNGVAPSLIRVDADEVTYCLHIVLRFELEVALIEGSLDVDDLPAAWNARFEELLGIPVPDDAHGVLQDPHWAYGELGYFPTYALGTIIAAQLWDAAREQLPGLEERIASGDLAPLRDWLGEHVHRHGRRRTSGQILQAATGGPLDPEPLLRYLREKFGALYGLG